MILALQMLNVFKDVSRLSRDGHMTVLYVNELRSNMELEKVE